ncbi:IclR family transcriptional regulator [Haloactinomyces albus]|uniref:DNA-binding IclR family transcriptional regulator n=1 Tax=Haloactinomyces albus TaxID=1352928 RepID=A0AAE3ZIU2_9ACTN|nr:IclR family transcriptional regulator [Haloactinomyces albus]MDR7303997.1 DNA-binding IclR family transcriptional regulator [Haloactinomyces albus]
MTGETSPGLARSDADGTGAHPKSVAARVLSVLEAFDTEHYALSLSDIARRSGLPFATCHRLIKELVTWGALVRIDGRYRIGHKLWSLGRLSPVRQDLAEVAAPFMHDVLFLTHHVVNLFVLDGTKALLLERISGTRPGPAVHRVGDRMGLHASAAGKVLLTHAPQQTIVRALENPERFTSRTVTDRAQVLRELAQVRESGFATTAEESAERTSGVAVPVTSTDGHVIAALGVVIVDAQPKPNAIVPVLQTAARGIARQVRFASGFDHERTETGR